MRRGLLTVALIAALFMLSSCAEADDAYNYKQFDPVGSWVGDYRYPDGSDVGVDSTETLVIEKRDGDLIWGYDEFLDNGELTRIPVRGSIDSDVGGIGLAEENGFFLGQILADDRIVVRFVRTDENYTSFAVQLTRK